MRPQHIVLRSTRGPRTGYTLMEIMVSVSLMMILMLAMSQVFAIVGREINITQSVMMTAGRLRSAVATLQNDLLFVSQDTTRTDETKWIKRAAANLGNDDEMGYFCVIEGRATAPNKTSVARDLEVVGPDNTVGDLDDILMFTAQTTPDMEPFRGRIRNPSGGSTMITSDKAEIIYFVRGNTLYRRVLLVIPDSELQAASPNPAGFYENNDISARYDTATTSVVANTFADLSRRENRYGHRGVFDTSVTPPTSPHKTLESVGSPANPDTIYYLGLPLVEETSHIDWDLSAANLSANYGVTIVAPSQVDYWTDPTSFEDSTGNRVVDSITGVITTLVAAPARIRVGEDVLLTNVIAFDVKVWDDANGARQFVDIGGAGADDFLTVNTKVSNLDRIYDTWSYGYERDGDGMDVGKGLDQLDDPVDGIPDVIDDIEEWQNPPPYTVPLKGLQITIRTFDPRSRHIRQMTLQTDLIKRR